MSDHTDDDSDQNQTPSSGDAGEDETEAPPKRPKRGAFPTPPSEIAKAKPYVPETDDSDAG